METYLKERLVGAAVLVLAAVVFIPVVLDGPDTDAHVSRTVALPDAGARRTVRIALDGGQTEKDADIDTEPATIDLVEQPPTQDAAMPTPDAAEPEPRTDIARSEAESPPAAGTAVEPSTTPTTPAPTVDDPAPVQPWTVQVGSFGSDDNAETLAARLRSLGYPAYVSRFDDGQRVHYRVRVGGFASRDAAADRAADIRAKTGEPARPARNR